MWKIYLPKNKIYCGMHRKRRYQKLKEVDISGQDMNASIDKKR